MIALSDSVIIVLSENSLIQHLFGKVFIRNLESRQINDRMDRENSELLDDRKDSALNLYVVNTIDGFDPEDALVEEVYGKRIAENVRNHMFIKPKKDEHREGNIKQILDEETIEKLLE